MESEHFIGKVAQKAILKKDGKVLIVRDSRVTNPVLWELPGGRLHKNELPEEGLRRELMEELGVEADIGEMIYSELFAQTKTGDPHILLAYTATLVKPAEDFTPDPVEVAEMKWIGISQLEAQPMYPNCLRALEVFFNLGDK